MHKGDFHFVRHNHFKIKYTELGEIYIFEILRSLAFTFIVIFIPIYLFNLHYSIKVILLYYFFFYFVEGFVEPITLMLIRHFGPKHSIAASVPFTLIHFWMLKTLPVYHWPLALLAVTGAFGVGFFWQAYHFDFSKSKRKKTTTTDISRLYVTLSLLSAVIPFFGGYIATHYGEGVVFSIVIALLLMGTLVLFKTSDKSPKSSKINLKKLKFKAISKDLIAYAGYSWETTVSMIFWPLFIYFILKNYQSVGMVTTASVLVSVFIMNYVGKRSDDIAGKRQKYIKVGGVTKAIIYVFKTLVSTIFGVYAINISRAIANSISMTPWISEYYLHADEESRREYLFVMELCSDITRAVMFLVTFAVAHYLSLEGVLIFGLLTGGLGALLAALMPPAKSEVDLTDAKIRVMPRPVKKAARTGA